MSFNALLLSIQYIQNIMNWCDFDMESVLKSVRQVCSALHQLPVLLMKSLCVHNRIIVAIYNVSLKCFDAEIIDKVQICNLVKIWA